MAVSAAVGDDHLVGLGKGRNLVRPVVRVRKATVDQQDRVAFPVDRIIHLDAVDGRVTALRGRRHRRDSGQGFPAFGRPCGGQDGQREGQRRQELTCFLMQGFLQLAGG